MAQAASREGRSNSPPRPQIPQRPARLIGTCPDVKIPRPRVRAGIVSRRRAWRYSTGAKAVPVLIAFQGRVWRDGELHAHA